MRGIQGHAILSAHLRIAAMADPSRVSLPPFSTLASLPFASTLPNRAENSIAGSVCAWMACETLEDHEVWLDERWIHWTNGCA